MRNGFIVEQGLALAVAAGAQTQGTVLFFQKHVAPLGASQAERHLQHGHQDFVEHAGGVEFARGFEEQREFLQVCGFLRNLDAGDLAEEIARRIRSAMGRIENGIGGVARSELEAIVALQFLPLNALAVNESAVLAALIDKKKSALFEHDESVIARHARIGDDQILIDLAPHAEGRAVQDDILLFISLDQYQRGKDTRTAGLWSPDGVQSHGTWRGLSYAKLYCRVNK